MDLNKNLLLNSDSYKYSQFNQYPPQTEGVFSYIESRGGHHDETLFFGLQMFLKDYLMKPIRMEDIDIAEAIIRAHGEPFYRGGWEYIVKKHGGHLPVRIKAVPEGMVIPVKNVLLTIENTDPNCYWLTSFLETALLRAVWYPTTVASNSYNSKKLILNYLIRNGDPNLIDFKMQDFGFRGVSSYESAGIGGLAHLVNFKGTDTVAALLYGKEFYHEDIAGFSIPASEHSVACSYNAISTVEIIDEKNELSYIRRMLEFLYTHQMVSIVGDAYDIYNFINLMGSIKDEIIEKTKDNKFVILRPDSGNPVEVSLKCAQLLDNHFRSTLNSKGYKVLNHVRLIQGDGVNYETIDRVLHVLEANGYSSDNIAFGQGGGLLQHVNRDDFKFAMKCSSVNVNGTWRDVYKDPVTDPGKTSKKGRLQLIKNEQGEYQTVLERPWNKDELVTIYENGQLLVDYTLEQVRINASQCLHNFFAKAE
jgi:nicotinamide phosphoribosyltransferase